jgi:hypothetical protein
MNLKRIAGATATAAMLGTLTVAGAAQAGPSADAKSERAGKPQRAVSYIVRGTISAVDTAAGTATVDVAATPGTTNKHARGWAGKTIVFDLSTAKVKVSVDRNADGKRDLADVLGGDRAKVTARLAKGSAPVEGQAVKAKRLTAKPVTETVPEPTA